MMNGRLDRLLKNSLEMLGVVFDSNFSFKEHVNKTNVLEFHQTESARAFTHGIISTTYCNLHMDVYFSQRPFMKHTEDCGRVNTFK